MSRPRDAFRFAASANALLSDEPAQRMIPVVESAPQRAVRHQLGGRGAGMVRGLRLCAWIAAALLGLACDIAASAPSLYRFEARLDDGPLIGTTFEGTFAFDAAASNGHGEEFLPLAALDFDLLGTHFSRDDIRQGGQVILVDGQLSFFTAAFFPPPPASAPVTDIAFGFGGPGVIGYVVAHDFEHGFGMGAVTLMSPVPEPSVAVLVAAGALALMSFVRLGKAAVGQQRRSRAARPT